MKALKIDDAQTSFRLGFLCSLAGTNVRLAADEEYVFRILPVLGDSSQTDWSIVWPNDARSAPAIVRSGSDEVTVPHEFGKAFAQGAFSALISAVANEGENPRICLLDAQSPSLPYLGARLGLSAPEDGAWLGVAALDVLGRVLDGAPEAVPSIGSAFDDWSVRIAHLTGLRSQAPQLLVQLVHPEAHLPKKEHISDSGYDLTLIYEKKRMGKTVLYGTGVILEAPFGWYFDVVPRSSIIKRGYILANSVGVIDRSYRGEIFVPLIKVDDAAPELELPARVAQLIPRPILHFPVKEVEVLSATRRGAGGFGSTGE